MAPIRGITDSTFRNSFSRFFKGIDSAINPFMDEARIYSDKKLSENRKLDSNSGIKTIPQLLTNNTEFLISMSEKYKELGYDEINLNLACPYPMVLRKKMGAALLEETDNLKRILDSYFKDPQLRLSLKIRTGLKSNDKFSEILEIINSYPIEEITLHPRTAEQMYAGTIDYDSFKNALDTFGDKLIYSGEINLKSDYDKLIANYPSLNKIMLGRGLLMNPSLAEQITRSNEEDIDIKTIKKFHDSLFLQYKERLSGPTHLLDKMKGIWSYLSFSIDDDDKRIFKKIKKCTTIKKYDSIVKKIFNQGMSK